MEQTQKLVDHTQASPKKTYVKPDVGVVQLIPEEAVLGTCKDSAGGESLCLTAGDGICFGPAVAS